MKMLFNCQISSMLRNFSHFLKKYFVILFVWVFCLHVYLCNVCVPCAYRSQKRMSDLLELELQAFVSCHVGVKS